MAQAILTKYIGPTDSRCAKVKAKAQAGSLIVAWDDALDVDQNHDAAANKLAESLGWLENRKLIGGGLPDGTGNAYILVSK
jgi:hypothetical protein